MKVTLHTTNKRLWGFETLATVTDDNGKIWEESVLHPENATNLDIINLAESKIITRLEMPVEPEMIDPLIAEKKALETEIAILSSAKEKLVADISVLEAEKVILEPIKVVK